MHTHTIEKVSYNNSFIQGFAMLTDDNNEYYIFGDFNAQHQTWNCVHANTNRNIFFNHNIRSDYFIYHTLQHTRYPQNCDNNNASTVGYYRLLEKSSKKLLLNDYPNLQKKTH